MPEAPIHIVDDDAPFRDSLRLLLEATGYAVREYDSGEAFLRHVEAHRDGCALVDVNMPGLDGLALQERLNALGVALPVIIMTGRSNVATAVRAMKAGAVDFIEKPFASEAMLTAVAAARARCPQPVAEDPQVAAFRSRLTGLTPREREILEAVVAGNPTKVIAYAFGISPRTVHVHRARIGEKLDVTGLSNLVRLALAAGVVPGVVGHKQ